MSRLKKQYFIRLVAALGAAGLIAIQIPMQGGIALARDGYPNGGGNFLGTKITNEQVFTGAAVGLLGASLIRSLGDKRATVTTPTTAPHSSLPVIATKDCPAATLVGDGSRSIYDMLADAPNNYSAIKGLIDDAGIAESLKNEGPFTLVAPNNNVLSDVPPATVSALRSDKTRFAEFLQNHTLIGRYKYEDLCTMVDKNLLTLSGNTVRLSHKDGKVFLNGMQVMPVDMAASNGYAHPLNGVITIH